MSTVVVPSAYDTSGNNARKFAKLSNGWLIASANGVTVDASGFMYIGIYVSKDNGSSWSFLCYISQANPTGYALCASGTMVYVSVYLQFGSSLGLYKFDAATVPVGSVVNIYSTPDGLQNEFDGTAITVNAAGTELHVGWTSKNSSLPHHFNVRYRKGTITGGGSTINWGSTQQVTSINLGGSSIADMKTPSIALKPDGKPVIVTSFLWNVTGNPADQRWFIQCHHLTTSWQETYIIDTELEARFTKFDQQSPCVAIDGNGHIHAVWNGLETTDNITFNILYSKSIDGGLTFSPEPIKLTSGNVYDQVCPSITVDPADNKLYLFWFGKIDNAYWNIRRIDFDGSAWSAITNVTTNSGWDAWHVSTMYPSASDAIRYIYRDGNAVRYDYIHLNSAPLAPTNLQPSGGAVVDRATVIRLSWTHNDSDGNSQSKFDLQYRVQGTSTWQSATQTTSNQFYDIPANTLTTETYEWQVRTYDQRDFISPYSSIAVFKSSGKPVAPTITSPANNALVPIANPTVTWSSSGQTDYELILFDATGAITLFSDIQTSTNKSKTITYNLENGKTYKIQLRIRDTGGLWSDAVTHTINVSYTPPAMLTVTAVVQSGYIELTITNPTPSGTEPNVTSNDLYRRKSGEAEWERIAAGMTANAFYNDYTVASGVTYEYKAVAYGDNSTVTESVIISSSITLRSVWLHDVADAPGTLHEYRFDGNGRTAAYTPNVTMMQFAGRSRPIAEFGEFADNQISATLQMLRDSEDIDKLRTLVRRRGTVCYRDGRGRKIFGIIAALPETDEKYGYSTTIQVIETAYSESI